jgi:hypothetical protein
MRLNGAAGRVEDEPTHQYEGLHHTSHTANALATGQLTQWLKIIHERKFATHEAPRAGAGGNRHFAPQLANETDTVVRAPESPTSITMPINIPNHSVLAPTVKAAAACV